MRRPSCVLGPACEKSLPDILGKHMSDVFNGEHRKFACPATLIE